MASAVRSSFSDTGAREHILLRQEIFQVSVASQRDGVGVLYQQELVGNFTALTLSDQRLLELEGLAILEAAQIAPTATMH